MKILERLHKIDDVYIISFIGVGLAIILIYFIATLSALKSEMSQLNTKIDTLEGGQTEKIKGAITSGLSQTIRDTMRDEFAYDRQNYKFIIED